MRIVIFTAFGEDKFIYKWYKKRNILFCATYMLFCFYMNFKPVVITIKK